MAVAFREIVHGSSDFEEECRLRDEVLRRPLGLNLFEEDLQGEREQGHFGLFGEQGDLRACGVVVFVGESLAKVRQVAVREAWQGQGLGKRLIKEIEETLRGRGVTRVVLHARRGVVAFYLGCGYAVEGEEFEEVGLAHLKMRKGL